MHGGAWRLLFRSSKAESSEERNECDGSIWPADRENALGWIDAGKTGPKQECLDYIKEIWTDMRPLSLQKKMEEQGNRGLE